MIRGSSAREPGPNATNALRQSVQITLHHRDLVLGQRTLQATDQCREEVPELVGYRIGKR